MPIQYKVKANSSAKEQTNRKSLVETAGSLIMFLNPLIIEDFSKLRAKNQALTNCFWDFAWLETIS